MMKILRILALLGFPMTALAWQPVQNIHINTAQTGIPNGSFYQIPNGTTLGDVAYIVTSNTSANALSLAVGTAGNEGTVLIIPATYPMAFPIQIGKGARLSLESMNNTTVSGTVEITILGDLPF